MNTSLTQFVLSLFFAAMYLPAIFFVIQRREEDRPAPAWLVVLFAVVAAVLNLTDAFWPSTGTDPQSLQELHYYGTLTLIALMVVTVQAFLQKETSWGWMALWAAWILGLALLLTNALGLSDVIWTNGITSLLRERLGPAWTTLGWLIFAVGLVLIIASASKQARQQLFRNRLNYWWPPFFLIFLNDIFLFSGVSLPGNPLRLAAAIFMAYVVVTHDLPDLRQILRRVLVYLVSATLIVGLYSGGFLLLQAVFGNSQNFNPLIAGAFISLILGLLFAPLFNLVNRAVNSWLRADQYDASRTIHQYSENISNILEMDKLASIAVGIILEAMQIERGFLFLVDSDRAADGQKVYKLSSAASPEERQKISVQLEGNGPVASYFLKEQRPLLQYDLDLLPAFRSVLTPERDWFTQLQTEVYIPIFAKRQWIGMLAFGEKLSGNRYSKEDLVTLSAHANQTAVALENARLVDNLMRLNNELRSARRALEKNNQDLERIDQAKSDFISIASHELRTPLTVIRGYTEMLLEDSSLGENVKGVIKGIHDGTIRLHEVMDSMFDIAQIDARTLKPHIQPVEIGLLIHEICLDQVNAAREREQTIEIDLPSLPYVKVDPNLLRKLFHHLIRNAVKFTPNKGKITISGHAVPAIMDLPNGGIEIVVSDTGVGVDLDFREIIFSKFFQPGELGKHSTSKTRFKGSGAGLGLALSKGIVEAHGGRIYVESSGYDEDNFPGSQFHVILPLSQLDEGEQEKTSVPMKVML